MKLQYSPCKWNPYAAKHFPEGTKPDTEITVSNEDTLIIDGDTFEFDADSVQWPDVGNQTGARILEAHREGGELYVTVRRFYTHSPYMDDRQYHEVKSSAREDK